MVKPKNINFVQPEVLNIVNGEDYTLTDTDLLNTISGLNDSSAPGPDKVPDTLIKKCAILSLTPLKLMW